MLRISLTEGDILRFRTELGKKVRSAHKRALVFKRLDRDSSAGLSRPEFRLVKIGAEEDERFLGDKSQKVLWDAAWMRTATMELHDWIFAARGPKQKESVFFRITRYGIRTMIHTTSVSRSRVFAPSCPCQ